MGAAFGGVDIIYKGVNVLGIGIIVLHGHFHVYTILCAFAVEHIFIKGRLALIQIRHKFLDSALIVEGMLMLFLPLIPEADP